MVAKKRGHAASLSAAPSTVPAQMEAILNLPGEAAPAKKKITKSKTLVRLPRGGKHLHGPNAGVEHPTVANKPLPQRLPVDTELPQSQPTPVVVAMGSSRPEF